jgi:hypothetical protein
MKQSWMRVTLETKYCYVYLQFIDQNHFIVVFESIVQIDELRMMQLIHDINFSSYQLLLKRVGNGNKLSSEDVTTKNKIQKNIRTQLIT